MNVLIFFKNLIGFGFDANETSYLFILKIYQKIISRFLLRDFYDEGAALINYRASEIESEPCNCFSVNLLAVQTLSRFSFF